MGALRPHPSWLASLVEWITLAQSQGISRRESSVERMRGVRLLFGEPDSLGRQVALICSVPFAVLCVPAHSPILLESWGTCGRGLWNQPSKGSCTPVSRSALSPSRARVVTVSTNGRLHDAFTDCNLDCTWRYIPQHDQKPHARRRTGAQRPSTSEGIASQAETRKSKDDGDL
ncbi:hypothetical protein BDV96DRAFT_38373 [Lophiotrema nucula]|uniref:Uncharacterized protein n=1 Tax=Lophiotrema nucula TaxID=690887 RepID=A0A6A5ZEP2_9PLEO|nr:hypothetical protein BDV96DRAFT_38373 [Lophiotrema nucula]